MPIEQSELMSQEFLFSLPPILEFSLVEAPLALATNETWKVHYVPVLFDLSAQDTFPRGGVDLTNIYLTCGWHSLKILLI